MKIKPMKLTIKRTGKRPIAFEGENIATHTTQKTNDTRWTTVSLYKTASGRYVVAIERLSQWEGESDHKDAVVCDTADDVVTLLEDQVPRLAPDIANVLGVAEHVN